MAEAEEEGDGGAWGGAFGEEFEGRVPGNDIWGGRVVEELVSVGETGCEGAHCGHARKRERGERGVGFDEEGVDLFEFKWCVEGLNEVLRVMGNGDLRGEYGARTLHC